MNEILLIAERLFCGVLVTIGICFSIASNAQDGFSNDELAPGIYQAAANLNTFYDDNIFRTKADEESDVAFELVPQIGYRSVFRKHYLELDYSGAYAWYRDFDSENYDDHKLNANLLLDLTPKLNFDVQGGYQGGHDARGVSGSRPSISRKPDTWKERRLFANAIYGRRVNQGQLAFSAETRSLEYDNNGQQDRDRDTDTFSGTFFYNMTAKTSWLFETRLADIDYVESMSANRDSREIRYLVGARWEVTGLTTGQIRAGLVKKEYDDSGASDYEGLTIEGRVEWQPRPIDNVVIGLNRSPAEGSASGTVRSDYTSTNFDVSWRHTLTERWAFLADLRLGNDDFRDGRDDDYRGITLGTTYDVAERIDLTASYTYDERESSVANLDYINHRIMFTLTLTQAKKG